MMKVPGMETTKYCFKKLDESAIAFVYSGFGRAKQLLDLRIV